MLLAHLVSDQDRHGLGAHTRLLGRMLFPAAYFYQAGRFFLSAVTLDETTGAVVGCRTSEHRWTGGPISAPVRRAVRKMVPSVPVVTAYTLDGIRMAFNRSASSLYLGYWDRIFRRIVAVNVFVFVAGVCFWATNVVWSFLF